MKAFVVISQIPQLQSVIAAAAYQMVSHVRVIYAAYFSRAVSLSD